MNYYLKVLQNYATVTGRARRSEYWYFFLFNLIISITIRFLGSAMAMDTSIISNIYSLLVLVPGICVAVRRMHDVGKSGWYCLIPIYNFILASTEGDHGENEYGEDPKEEVI